MHLTVVASTRPDLPQTQKWPEDSSFVPNPVFHRFKKPSRRSKAEMWQAVSYGRPMSPSPRLLLPELQSTECTQAASLLPGENVLSLGTERPLCSASSSIQRSLTREKRDAAWNKAVGFWQMLNSLAYKASPTRDPLRMFSREVVLPCVSRSTELY